MLGLAILFAKAVADQMPFLVLDDITDALDESHRVAVVSTLFTTEMLDNKQIIITAHYQFAREINEILKSTTLQFSRLKLREEANVAYDIV